MTQEIIRLQRAVVQFEMVGSWFLADELRKIIDGLLALPEANL
jgi:hypothetical protein